MADSLAVYNAYNLGTIGTFVISNRATGLVRVVFPGTYVGTVNFHDSATAAGTTATSSVLILGLPATSVAGNIEVGASLKNGLTIESTGTPTLTIIWGG